MSDGVFLSSVFHRWSETFGTVDLKLCKYKIKALLTTIRSFIAFFVHDMQSYLKCEGRKTSETNNFISVADSAH